MKIVGLLVTGSEAHRYLRATLSEFKRLCDDVVVATNNADKATIDMLDEYGFWHYEDNREWGKFQPRIKTDLLKKIGKLKPDWVLPLDADEVFSSTFTRKELEELCNAKAQGWYFYIVNLWNDSSHYWHQGSFWNVRLFRFSPELGLEYIKKNVHCGLAPPYAYNFGRYAPHIVKHYGLIKKEDRDAKVQRYRIYDPRNDKIGIGAYYEAIRGEGGGREFIQEELERKVEEEVEKMNQDVNKIFDMEPTKSFVYVKRLKDGKIIDIPESDLEGTLLQGFVFVSKISMVPAATQSVPIEKDELMCPLCDVVCKTKTLLAMHKGRFHK